MQTGRLFSILYLLMEHGNMTAKQLAERFEVSPRTIYRDIDLLSGAGIPIYASKGKGGGIQLLSHFVLDRCFLPKSRMKFYSPCKAYGRPTCRGHKCCPAYMGFFRSV